MIDKQRLQQVASQLDQYISKHFQQETWQYINSKNIEGYKDELYVAARGGEPAVYSAWKDEDCGTGKIRDFLIHAISLQDNNLVDWRNKDQVRQLLNKAQGSHLFTLEKAFFNLYRGTDDPKCFSKICDVMGLKKFDVMGFYYFIKDKDRYLPIRSSIFDTLYDFLFIDHDPFSGNCDWQHYMTFINLMEEIRDELQKIYPEENISLLDAHSFVWTINIIGPEKFKLPDDEESIIKRILVTADRKNINVPGDLYYKCATNIRTSQHTYRKLMIDYWDGKCAVTGCGLTDVLIASHAKGYRDCKPAEAIDYYNGFLLTPNLDKLFDQGLISFDDRGKIMISSKITQEEAMQLGLSPDMRLQKIEEGHRPYLEYHRKNVFNKRCK